MHHHSTAVAERRLPALAVLMVTLLLVGACRGTGGEPGGPAPAVRTVATLAPLAWLVERVGGERAATTVLLPPGTSPHAFEPSPRQLREMAAADLLVAVGHPDLAFEQQQVRRLTAGRPELVVVTMTDGGDPGADLPGVDPHLWTAPRPMAATARRLAAALEGLDPEGATDYRRHLAALEEELRTLDRELEDTFTALPRRTFYVQHPAWGHLAADYGLHQVALEEEGKEPSAQELVALIRQARRGGVRAVFVQRGEPRQAARAFAAETGAEVVELDPLAYDWPAEIQRTAAALHDALAPDTP